VTPPVRAALYARVSLEKQAERFGLSSQITELEKLAAARGYTLVGRFVDDGISGATLDRPRLNALRDLVRQHGVDVVLAHATDRVSRELGHYLAIVAEFRRQDVRLEFCSHTPQDTAEGRLHESMLGAFAEYEREKIRERTARGGRAKAQKGLKPTGAAAYGYRTDPAGVGGLVVDEAEAATVRRIFTWAADGVPIRTIAHRLDVQGIAPRRGGKWSRTSVRTVLHNQTYTGTGVYNRRDESKATVRIRPEAEWITYSVPPIVSPALAERARAHLRRNVHLRGGRPAKRVYLLAGVLACGRCGRRMHGDSGNRTATYRCEGRLLEPAQRCRHTTPAAALDGKVWDALAAVLRNPDLLRRTAKAGQLGIDARRVDAGTEVAEATRALTKATAVRARLLDAYLAGAVSKAEFDARGPRVQAEVSRLEHVVAEAQARLDAGQAEADTHAALVRYCALAARGLDRLDAAGRQAAVRRLVKRVSVYADRIEIEAPLTLTLSPAPEPGGGKLRHAAPSAATLRRPIATRREPPTSPLSVDQASQALPAHPAVGTVP
jgi:site-specific DNA recombinase